jgi:hypothetical protein
LVRLLDAWRWEDFLHEEPRVFSWSSIPHLIVSSHPHSGGTLAVRLDTGDDPLLFWGWEDEEKPANPNACRFSDYIYRYVQNGRDRKAGERLGGTP